MAQLLRQCLMFSLTMQVHMMVVRVYSGGYVVKEACRHACYECFLSHADHALAYAMAKLHSSGRVGASTLVLLSVVVVEWVYFLVN